MKQRLTKDDFRIGFDDSDLLPSYVAIYERLREYEIDSASIVCCKECIHKNKSSCPAYDAPMNRTSLRIEHCSCGEK